MKKFLFMFCFLLATNNLFCDDNYLNKQIDTSYTAQKKSTTGAILRSLALPGWGQIYVEHYWRAPIFFAGATTLLYFVIDNHLKANDLKKQIDIIENKNAPEVNLLKRKYENAIDNRDLSALCLIGVYTLATIDAYAGAHLFDFKIGNNELKINAIPSVETGVKLQIRYKF